MAIVLAEKFSPYVDEKFYAESKLSILTNNDFDWIGAHSVKVWKVSTSAMNDYDRAGTGTGKTGSRFGAISSLDNSTEEFTLTKDRSFTFAIDKMDTDETSGTLAAAAALARQLREVVIPEVDSHVYSVITMGAGTKPTEITLTKENIYDSIITANTVMDDAMVPETGRVLIVTPSVYQIMKKSTDIVLNTEIGQDMRLRGVIGNLDGVNVVKVPASRLPAGFGFLLAHPVATVAPQKLSEYRVHQDPPGISGSLVEGRIYYDAFVLDNKKQAIYYQAQPTT